MDKESTGGRMPIRDADLRQEAHARGAGPGSKLWGLLVELQKRRDAAETGSETIEVATPREGATR